MSSELNPITVRDATEDDLVSVHSIYAYEVLNGLATFEEIPPSVDELIARWKSILSVGLPYLIAVRGGKVVGYSYASRYRPRPAYRHTVENSVYVASEHQGRGVGRSLLRTLIERCEQGSCRQMIAVIGDSANVGSVALHKAFGFRAVGTLIGAGFKHGRWVDTVLMQRALGMGIDTLPGQ